MSLYWTFLDKIADAQRIGARVIPHASEHSVSIRRDTVLGTTKYFASLVCVGPNGLEETTEQGAADALDAVSLLIDHLHRLGDADAAE